MTVTEHDQPASSAGSDAATNQMPDLADHAVPADRAASQAAAAGDRPESLASLLGGGRAALDATSAHVPDA